MFKIKSDFALTSLKDCSVVPGPNEIKFAVYKLFDVFSYQIKFESAHLNGFRVMNKT